MPRFNGTINAWKPDDESGTGTINSTTGRFVPGAIKSLYLEEEPCLVQGFTRVETRDVTEFASANDPARITIDVTGSLFAMGDYVSVSYRDVEARVGEIRSIGWSPRGRRQTVLVIEWRSSETSTS